MLRTGAIDDGGGEEEVRRVSRLEGEKRKTTWSAGTSGQSSGPGFLYPARSREQSIYYYY